MSMGGQEDGTGTGVPTRIPSMTRKRYSSSFGNRYVGSVGSVGGGGGVGSGESGRSTPASVSASTGATGGVGVLEDGKRKEQIAIGVSCFTTLLLLHWRFRYINSISTCLVALLTLSVPYL
jgi:hypothetical protein